MSCRPTKKIYPTTSLDENCIVWISNRAGLLRWFERRIWLLKLKFVNGGGYETYNTEEVKKEHKEEAKADEETEEEPEAPVPLVTHLENILHSVFSTVEVYINNQQTYNSKGLYAHKSYISNNFKEAISEYKRVLHCDG